MEAIFMIVLLAVVSACGPKSQKPSDCPPGVECHQMPYISPPMGYPCPDGRVRDINTQECEIPN